MFVRFSQQIHLSICYAEASCQNAFHCDVAVVKTSPAKNKNKKSKFTYNVFVCATKLLTENLLFIETAKSAQGDRLLISCKT